MSTDAHAAAVAVTRKFITSLQLAGHNHAVWVRTQTDLNGKQLPSAFEIAIALHPGVMLELPAEFEGLAVIRVPWE